MNIIIKLKKKALKVNMIMVMLNILLVDIRRERLTADKYPAWVQVCNIYYFHNKIYHDI